MVLKPHKHQNHLEGLAKHRGLGPTPEVSESVGLRSLRTSDTDTAGHGATPVNHWTRTPHSDFYFLYNDTVYRVMHFSLSHSLFAIPAATTLIQLFTPHLFSWNALCLFASEFSYYNFPFKCYLWGAFPDLLVISNGVWSVTPNGFV